jgi:hypothetical protein
MKAKLLPLKGKYYGSEIEITTEFPSWPLTHIKIWCNADYVPSNRQLKKLGISLKEVGSGELCWSHMESEFSYQLAEYLVDCIEKFEYRKRDEE